MGARPGGGSARWGLAHLLAVDDVHDDAALLEDGEGALDGGGAEAHGLVLLADLAPRRGDLDLGLGLERLRLGVAHVVEEDAQLEAEERAGGRDGYVRRVALHVRSSRCKRAEWRRE